MSNPDLLQFGHFLGAALAVNLGYSVLLRLGDFSGKRIGGWVDQEKVRIIPPMAETDGFNESKFTSDVDGLERKYKRRIRLGNVCTIAWALISVLVVLVLLDVAPYCSCQIPPFGDIVMVLFLTGATPVGVILFLLFQNQARNEMSGYTKEFDGLIKYGKTNADEKIKKLQQELQERLARTRNHLH
jgi:hypothetical protein